MDHIVITDNKKEMESIGRSLAEEHKNTYTPLMLDKIMERIRTEVTDEDSCRQEQILYCSIYDWWVYGNNIDEEFYYQFYNKTHEEKNSYMTNRLRAVYMDYLCCGGGYQLLQLFEKKGWIFLKENMIATKGCPNITNEM